MDVPLAVATLTAAAGGETRVVPLGDRTVLRTPARPDHRAGTALLLHAATDADGLRAALAEGAARLGPRARVVVPVGGNTVGGLVAVAVAAGAVVVPAVVVTHADAAGWAAATAPRADLALAVPRDERGWHGVAVLQRHATDGASRGDHDARHRWWATQLATLASTGRARVLAATRHGTPAGAGALVWVPGADVGSDHAGLAVLAGHVVHPAHRRLGVGAALARTLVGAHLADFPRARVAAAVPAALLPAARGTGWDAVAELLVVDL